ncbi:MAG: IS21 family transposase [Gemmatimonadaceae bacterium]|nr:IS21 family transposase [Gemmatimonadaceae bacterium]
MDAVIQAGGLSGRAAAHAVGVTEGALRYRRKRLASGAVDGRRHQPTALAGFEAAVAALVAALEPDGVSARLVYEALVAQHGYCGSYPAVVRYLRRQRATPRLQAVRRVETPPGMQAQHDWFDWRVEVEGSVTTLHGLLGTLSHSRGAAVWLSRRLTQVAWQTGHAALFRAYGGVPRVVRIDHCKTGVAAGAGPSAVLSPAFAVFARTCGFVIDPCRVRTPRDKGKVERRVRTLHAHLAPLAQQTWSSLPALQTAVDARLAQLHDRLRCPATGTSIAAAWAAEQPALQALPLLSEPFDVIAARRVQRDSLICFEGRQYSVPFAWIGRDGEVIGTAHHVEIRGDGHELARHPRHTAARLVLDPAHYDGPSTARVLAPPPLGHRGRWQVDGVLPGLGTHQLQRGVDAYAQLMEETRR